MNSWQVGALYPPGGLNNIAWQQPGGVGTQVFPAQQTSVDYFAVTPFSELTGVFSSPCGHFENYPLIQQEFDYETGSSVALVCCPLCGYVVYTIEPFELALNPVANPQLPI
jgi:hypothetical protein